MNGAGRFAPFGFKPLDPEREEATAFVMSYNQLLICDIKQNFNDLRIVPASIAQKLNELAQFGFGHSVHLLYLP